MQANEIKNHKFPSKMRGYDRQKVDAYLNELSVMMNTLEMNNQHLQQELYEANSKLDDLHEKEATVNRSIMVAQQAADRLRETSLDEADLIIKRAEETAKQIMTKACDQAMDLLNEQAQLRETSRYYIFQMQGLINNAKQVLDDPKWQDLFKDVPQQAVECPTLKQILEEYDLPIRDHHGALVFDQELEKAQKKQVEAEFLNQSTGNAKAVLPSEVENLLKAEEVRLSEQETEEKPKSEKVDKSEDQE